MQSCERRRSRHSRQSAPLSLPAGISLPAPRGNTRVCLRPPMHHGLMTIISPQPHAKLMLRCKRLFQCAREDSKLRGDAAQQADMEVNEKDLDVHLHSLPERDVAGAQSAPLRRATSGKASVTTAAATNPGASVQSRGTAIELCCGMGGMGIGLRELGYEVKRAYDVWADAVSIYNHNFGDEARECNLLTGAGRQLVQEGRKGLGDLELFAAGPPCKGF